MPISSCTWFVLLTFFNDDVVVVVSSSNAVVSLPGSSSIFVAGNIITNAQCRIIRIELIPITMWYELEGFNFLWICCLKQIKKKKEIVNGLESPQIEHYMTNNLQTSGHFCTCAFRVNWADDKQTSWIIALWWLSVSLCRICITLVLPSRIFCIIKLSQALSQTS